MDRLPEILWSPSILFTRTPNHLRRRGSGRPTQTDQPGAAGHRLSLFDGHDAAINIMRRIFQSPGREVIHLGHNRSVQEVVDAALEEDVQGVAVSSYQGGHIEYFEYLVELAARARRRPRQGRRRRRRGDRAGRDRAPA